MPYCTICGVGFAEPEQVRAHIQGSTGDHAGIGYADAEKHISDTPPSGDDGGDPPGDPPGGSASEASSPSKDEGLWIPQRDVSASSAGENSDPECPECGSNRYFDASEYTDYPFGCAECSDSTSWTVYGKEGAA